jgi:hypothetical protein
VVKLKFAQNYWVFGLCPLSGILKTKKTMFWKLDLFPSSGERGIGWDEARILVIENNSRYRKYKELAHTACLNNPIQSNQATQFGHISFLDPTHQQ